MHIMIFFPSANDSILHNGMYARLLKLRLMHPV